MRSRSRSPKGDKKPAESGHVRMCTRVQSSMPCFFSSVGKLSVLELEVPIAPRDVHKSKGVWVVNQKAKKNIEVTMRKLCATEQKEFEQAMRVETDSFMSTEAVRICERAGIPKERIMGMRFVLTWKTLTDDEGQASGRKAKARLIVRGFEDPGLLEVSRESPTLSTMGRNLLMAECAQKAYGLSVGDIKTAFLRGDNTELEREVYAEPPPEVKQHLGMSDTQLFRIVKAIYGLLHAPKKWHESLSRFLQEDGWTPHALDSCLYKLVDPQGCVVGYLGIHVDDVVTGGVGSFYEQKIGNLRQRYPFGSWQSASDATVLYCGCEVTQDKDFRILLKQERFALSVDEINLTKERQKEAESDVTSSEQREFRKVLGALNWRATQAAPWILATVSHLQGCIESAKVSDLLEANKLVRLQRRYCDRGLCFESTLQDPIIVTYHDASWATRRDLSSQGGQLTVLMEGRVLKGHQGKFSVLNWTSRRLKRVARSSTSAEVQMCGNALDTHEFLKLAYLDMQSNRVLDLQDVDPYLQEIPSILVCDSKNVYDGLAKVESTGLHMEEKRTAIELLGIKARLIPANISIRWVDGDQELADCLTKPWVYDQLLRALDLGSWKIVFDSEMLSAKKKRQLQKALKTSKNETREGS